MKPYPEYKTTGLPWLPKIPKHWEIMRNKNVLIERKDVVGGESKNYRLLSLTLQGIILRDMDILRGKFPAEFDSYKIVCEGDIVFCLFDIDETPRTVGISSLLGMITGAYDVFWVRGAVPRFLYYYYLSIDNKKALKPYYTGLRKVIKVDTFLGIKLPIPPADEQAKIVRYLDVMTAKIDKLIAAKKKQIALLQEKKQAVINQAVTRGLNPEVELKDSGIDWLGKIPKHWARDKVSRLFGFIGSGTTPSVGDQSFNDEKECIPWINSGDLYYADPFIPHISKKLPEAFLAKYSALKKYPENTIVIAMYGASIGNLGISREVACCNQACCCLWGPNSNITLLFSYYALLACKSVWQEKSNGGGQPNISQEIVRQTWLPVPPLVEQIGIARKLDLFSDGLRTVIQNLEKEIALCADYKNSLISSIVTGAVDVREIEISSAELMWEDAEGMCATRD